MVTRRQLWGRVGGLTTHALHDSAEITAPARAAARAKLDAKLLAEIDPENVLSLADRSKRLERARKAYFTALALSRKPKRKAA